MVQNLSKITWLSLNWYLMYIATQWMTMQGADLTSALWTGMCRLLWIKHTRTTAYHPQCNGQVGRFNRTLKGGYRCNQSDWGVYLPNTHIIDGLLWLWGRRGCACTHYQSLPLPSSYLFYLIRYAGRVLQSPRRQKSDNWDHNTCSKTRAVNRIEEVVAKRR